MGGKYSLTDLHWIGEGEEYLDDDEIWKVIDAMVKCHKGIKISFDVSKEAIDGFMVIKLNDKGKYSVEVHTSISGYESWDLFDMVYHHMLDAMDDIQHVWMQHMIGSDGYEALSNYFGGSMEDDIYDATYHAHSVTFDGCHIEAELSSEDLESIGDVKDALYRAEDIVYNASDFFYDKATNCAPLIEDYWRFNYEKERCVPKDKGQGISDSKQDD